MNSLTTRALITCAMLCIFGVYPADAQPSQVPDVFESEHVGQGLGIYNINEANQDPENPDYLNDIVASSSSDGFEIYGNAFWGAPVGYFAVHQTVSYVDGFECKWGNLNPEETCYYIAFASNNVRLNQLNNDWRLQPLQLFQDQEAAHISWGDVMVGSPDGWDDLVASPGAGAPPWTWWLVRIYHNNHNNQLDNPIYFDPGGEIHPNKLELVDLDYLPDYTEKELVFADQDDGMIYICQQDGQGSFLSTGMQEINVGEDITDFAVGDIDNDDYNDIVVCSYNWVKTYLNNHSGGFDETQTLEGCFQVALGEWDHNYTPDMAVWYVPSYEIREVRIYENRDNGSGLFNTEAVWDDQLNDLPENFVPYELIFAGLNGKGAHSLVMTGDSNLSDTGRLYVWFNNADPLVQSL